MAEARITAGAEEDYRQALQWYAQHSLTAAQGFEVEFDRVIQSIEKNPQYFPRCDSQHRFHLMRRYPFQVIYRETSQGILIVAVAHAKREPGYWHTR